VCNLRSMMDTPSIDWAAGPLLCVAVSVAVGVAVGALQWVCCSGCVAVGVLQCVIFET